MLKKLPEKLKKVLNINTDSPYYYLGVLAVALLIFGFSFYQAQSNISEPFKIGMARFNNVDIPESDSLDLKDAEALKKLDTDGDGLSDYLELYVYGTSAYIEDTDSDGLSDRIEVVSGANPLCSDPDGCNTDIFSGAPTQQDNIIANYGGEEELRIKLKEFGYLESDLDGLAVGEMITLYEETVAVLSGNSGNNLTDSLYDATAEDIKSMLLSSGVTEEELSLISDEQLLEMYRQVLNDNNTTY